MLPVIVFYAGLVLSNPVLAACMGWRNALAVVSKVKLVSSLTDADGIIGLRRQEVPEADAIIGHLVNDVQGFACSVAAIECSFVGFVSDAAFFAGERVHSCH